MHIYVFLSSCLRLFFFTTLSPPRSNSISLTFSISFSFLFSFFFSLSLARWRVLSVPHSLSCFLSVSFPLSLSISASVTLFVSSIPLYLSTRRSSGNAMHCNRLQCIATDCSALQQTAVHCNRLQCTAVNCCTLQLVAFLSLFRYMHRLRCSASRWWVWRWLWRRLRRRLRRR